MEISKPLFLPVGEIELQPPEWFIERVVVVKNKDGDIFWWCCCVCL